MSLSWLKKHPMILGPRWLVFVSTKALPQTEGFCFSHPQICQIKLRQDQTPSLLDEWREQMNDFPLVMVCGAEDELDPNLRSHFRFGVGTQFFKHNLHWDSLTLSWGSKSYKSKDLAEALLLVRQDEILLQKGRFPWLRAWTKILLALILGFCLPFLVVQNAEIKPALQLSNRSLATEQKQSLEISAKTAYELRKKMRVALFKMGYLVTDVGWIETFLNRKLKQSGYPAWNSSVDQVYSPLAVLNLHQTEMTLPKLSKHEWQAYQFLNSLILDSLAYPTDYWWNGAESMHRNHDGVDVAAPMGTRLVAPFAGKLYTWENDRAGKVAAIIQGNWVFLFAHCEQILFFNGDHIRQGDAVATVGVTGHTTGPHAHIAVGRLTNKYTGGHPSYTQINPIEWYVQNKTKLRLP